MLDLLQGARNILFVQCSLLFFTPMPFVKATSAAQWSRKHAHLVTSCKKGVSSICNLLLRVTDTQLLAAESLLHVNV